MLVSLAERSDRMSFDHLVISLHDDNLYPEEMETAAVPYRTLSMRRRRAELTGLFRLIKILRRYRPHIVQTWLYHADLLGLIAGKAAFVPFIGWNMRGSDMDLKSYSWLANAVRRMCAIASPLVSFAISNSVAGREYHKSIGYRPRHWEVIYNGFDVRAFAPDADARRDVRVELGIPDEAPVIGMLARYDRMKDFPTFFEAAAIVGKARRDVHFLLAGTGVESTNAELKLAIGNARYPDNIHLLGPRRDAPRLFAAMDVCTLTSAFGEGFPTVLGEAMACGVPCVATDVGDTRTVIGDAGITVPPRHPQAVASAWLEMLALDEAQRKALSDRARQRIVHEFDVDRIVRQYEEFYRSLLVA